MAHNDPTSNVVIPNSGPMMPVPNQGTSVDVKSTAVVKYTSVKFPVQISQIRQNTDLNHPPSDRHHSGYYMFSDRTRHATREKFSEFLSLNMADTYQDLVGQVDVISSSKNIKALLKMPYSDSPHISIMVHRLRKTLLLEEFDVHKNLLKMHAEDWSWLKKYYYTVVTKDQEKAKFLTGTTTKRDSFAENMYMNLIRHCYAASIEDEKCTALEAHKDKSRQMQPIPETLEDLKGFHHETMWKFEDMSMLIDSDLPIFGHGETPRPCISLRLRDAGSPPINILTGLDYWLDNLMSNVPEVAMCYHVNGFVKKYEVIKTEDIPNLENSKFDPNEVLDIAQNIMSFIKRNAAVEGHTYWLYKSENDDMVKLYDLTDYCKNEIMEGDNPFTVPVGLLCHRVGSNLKRTGQRRMADARAMFENCLRLLDDAKHAQVCADAHLHLSDMWVPDKSVIDIWQEKGKISDPPSDLYDEDEASSDESNGVDLQSREISHTVDDGVKAITGEADTATDRTQEELKNSVALKELVVRGMIKRKAWEVVHACRIAGTTDERCRMALTHIRKGLNCIDRDQGKGKNIGLVEKQQTCSPSKAIPLFYQPLNVAGKDRAKESSDRAKESTEQEEGDPEMCDPSRAIPLKYTPLNKMQDSAGNMEQLSNILDAINIRTSADHVTPVSGSNSFLSEVTDKSDASEGSSRSGCHDERAVYDTWHVDAKFQLLRKAAITYFILAKEFFEIKKYGHTLRHLRYAVHCYEACELFKSVKDDSQDLYVMLLYLAAQARCCLVSNWHQCHRDFDELGEEEAAILHSAQTVIPTPKNSWVYEWPSSQEANMLAANELYEEAFKLPALEKKSASFRLLMKKNHAACVMNLGNTQMEICKDKVMNNKDLFENIKAVWEKGMKNYQKSIRMFEAVNDRNTAGHVCSNAAYLHVIAAASVHNSTTEIGFLPQEKDHLLKAIEWYEKGLSKYDRGEGMDDARENIYHNMRMQYQEMATRYFLIPPRSVTEQDLRSMKDLIQKSLSYCFLTAGGRQLKKSQICAGLNHLNLARIFDVESFKSTHQTRKKNFKQKMEENFQKAFEIYHQIKWRRSQMCVKYFWLETITEEAEANASVKGKKKLFHAVFTHLCELLPPLYAIENNDFDPEDNLEILSTNFLCVKKLHTDLNTALMKYFKLDKSNSSIKQLYQRSLGLVNSTTLVELLKPLCAILVDLNSLLTTDLLH
ncbi:erythroid differentiation-related factor 1-like [Physella acuta]|uniref:erythroid differentiation-related factor 1-like n=1 Tax=Physella acuta TaxID=109671 RepID=UPI0027DC1ACB|nr:erythroid differentiation-related factor 1-like [Physella acuta]